MQARLGGRPSVLTALNWIEVFWRQVACQQRHGERLGGRRFGQWRRLVVRFWWNVKSGCRLVVGRLGLALSQPRLRAGTAEAGSCRRSDGR